MAFILTCQNYLCSTYSLFHPESPIQKQDCVLDSSQRPPALFAAFPITNAQCQTTSDNTYFNYSDAEINPTCGSFGDNSSDTLCNSETCFNFHEFSPDICDNIISSAHLCNHSKVNLQFVPEAETNKKDLHKTRGRKQVDIPPVLPDLFSQSPAIQTRALPCPTSDIWPANKPATLPPPDDLQDGTPPQIFGDLNILDPLPIGQPPDFITTDHFNSLLFLSFLLKTNDNLSAMDLQMMQQLDPHFRLIMSNAAKHKDYSVDKDGILFKHLTPAKGPSF